MTERLHFSATAKALHWLVVILLINQYVIGWRMPDIEPGMTPGDEMTWHVSFGLFILAVIILRLIWRLTHPVAPESSLAAWQRLGSEAVHWLLYLLVLATTVLGWFFASAMDDLVVFHHSAADADRPRLIARPAHRPLSSRSGICAAGPDCYPCRRGFPTPGLVSRQGHATHAAGAIKTRVVRRPRVRARLSR